VNGFDYRQSAVARVLGRRPAVALPRTLRPALAAIATALLLVAAVGAIERARIGGLDGELAALAARSAAAERDDARTERLEASVESLRALRADLDAARRSTALEANTIVRIGNRLPPQTWLTSVTTDPSGVWSIGGRSTRLDEIGTTLGTIARLDRRATTRLVAINASGRRASLLDFTVSVVPHP
jgi:Tfp pilus assembly protein PilN